MEYRLRATGYTLCFYHKENDAKLSFFIADEPELTANILSHVKTKRVNQKDIRYVIKAVDALIINMKLEKVIMETNENPIVELGQVIQKKYGRNIIFSAPVKTGLDHCPTIEVMLTLPNGDTFVGIGRNQRIARENASRIALSKINL